MQLAIQSLSLFHHAMDRMSHNSHAKSSLRVIFTLSVVKTNQCVKDVLRGHSVLRCTVRSCTSSGLPRIHSFEGFDVCPKACVWKVAYPREFLPQPVDCVTTGDRLGRRSICRIPHQEGRSAVTVTLVTHCAAVLVRACDASRALKSKSFACCGQRAPNAKSSRGARGPLRCAVLPVGRPAQPPRELPTDGDARPAWKYTLVRPEVRRTLHARHRPWRNHHRRGNGLSSERASFVALSPFVMESGAGPVRVRAGINYSPLFPIRGHQDGSR